MSTPTLPPLSHLRRLSDDTGLLQFATFGVPNPHHGYTLDDNVRGLLVAYGYYHQGAEREAAALLADRYLSFIHWAQRSDGRFHNELSYTRQWLDDVGSEDAHGRALWALGYAAVRPIHAAGGKTAAELFRRALPYVPKMRFLRARAYATLGMAHLVRVGHPLSQQQVLGDLATSLLRDWEENTREEWRWFEDRLTYDNGCLPHALLVAGHILGEEQYLRVAEEALQFLLAQVREKDYVVLIGQDGWYRRGKARARYDQQPIDAASLAEVCAVAAHVLEKPEYRAVAEAAWDWFHGRNSEGLPLYDPETGGCRDGLKQGQVNQNQGAESTLALLQAALALRDLDWLGVDARR